MEWDRIFNYVWMQALLAASLNTGIHLSKVYVLQKFVHYFTSVHIAFHSMSDVCQNVHFFYILFSWWEVFCWYFHCRSIQYYNRCNNDYNSLKLKNHELYYFHIICMTWQLLIKMCMLDSCKSWIWENFKLDFSL